MCLTHCYWLIFVNFINYFVVNVVHIVNVRTFVKDKQLSVSKKLKQMIAIPQTHEDVMALEKANNIVVKLNGTGKLNGLVPAYRKIANWIGYKEEWQIVYVAAKQYHTLIDSSVKSNVNYDLWMDQLKSEYVDYAGRVARIFQTESETIEYLTNN